MQALPSARSHPDDTSPPRKAASPSARAAKILASLPTPAPASDESEYEKGDDGGDGADGQVSDAAPGSSQSGGIEASSSQSEPDEETGEEGFDTAALTPTKRPAARDARETASPPVGIKRARQGDTNNASELVSEVSVGAQAVATSASSYDTAPQADASTTDAASTANLTNSNLRADRERLVPCLRWGDNEAYRIPVQHYAKATKKDRYRVGYPNYQLSRKLVACFIEDLGADGLTHYTSFLARAPWNRMWEGRVRRLYLLDPNLLPAVARGWQNTYCHFMYTHRQALWERYHWLPAPSHDRPPPGWGTLLTRRKDLENYLQVAWKALQALRPPSWPTGFGVLLEQEPAFWSFAPHHCSWIPDPAVVRIDGAEGLAAELARVDQEEPLRVQYGGNASRLIESLDERTQFGFQLLHYAGVSWEIPPWNRAGHEPAPLGQRFAGTPGPNFYLDSYPSAPLDAFYKRAKAIRKFLKLMSDIDMSKVSTDNTMVRELRKILLAPIEPPPQAQASA
ncbi:hypothetical protein P43SY_008718 [Pythium insidiosum]|uniref:Uncharacterized protein n=1 Tax=Pythium insidiosum TaxID=114742 RepID=A0AAD5LTP6_PYTIN|nr:hypothetical protein P43SY_008718 [Pythium insidiosum]